MSLWSIDPKREPWKVMVIAGLLCLVLYFVFRDSSAPNIITDSDRAEYALKARLRGDPPGAASTEDMYREDGGSPDDIAPTPTASRQSEPDRQHFRVRYNEEFKLGDYSYKITSVQTAKAVGPEFLREKASDGAVYLLVNYFIRNDGKQTAETDANDFRLLDTEEREYSPDSRGTTAVSSDFILRELHPGIFKKAVVAFEVPESVMRSAFRIVVPEKGVGLENRKTAFLLLMPAHRDSPTPIPRPNSAHSRRDQ
jgi:hypothetical protein